MEALRSKLFALLIITTISLSWQSEKLLPDNDPCRLFADGTKLRKPGTCTEHIVCRNFTSIPDGVCTGNTPWYSTSSGCTRTQPKDKYCEHPCSKTSPLFVTDKKSCHGWWQCNGSKMVKNGICPGNQIFNQKQQMCNYEDTKCVKTYEICDIVKPSVKYADENNCHKYFECNGSKGATSKVCPTGQYYDRAKAACFAKATVNCYKHPYPDEVCGNTKIAYRNRFVDDQATCRGYFYCADKGVGVPDTTPRWDQCANPNDFFNPKEQACMARAHVKCNEDRCDGRKEGDLEISGQQGCQHYLICGNGGVTIKEQYCGDGNYFDPITSQCTTVRRMYPACA